MCSTSGAARRFPIALEGALKLKEISYIHAEGYAGGEMKHGPIALIDEAVPVVVVAPTDAIFDKIASNFEQVKARGGKLVLLSDPAGNARLGAPRGGGDQPAPGRSGRGADPLQRAGAAAGLLHGGRQRHRRRPAPQPRQERDGGVIIGALPHPNGISRTGRRKRASDPLFEPLERSITDQLLTESGNSVAIVPSRSLAMNITSSRVSPSKQAAQGSFRSARPGLEESHKFMEPTYPVIIEQT